MYEKHQREIHRQQVTEDNHQTYLEKLFKELDEKEQHQRDSFKEAQRQAQEAVCRLGNTEEENDSNKSYSTDGEKVVLTHTLYTSGFRIRRC